MNDDIIRFKVKLVDTSTFNNTIGKVDENYKGPEKLDLIDYEKVKGLALTDIIIEINGKDVKWNYIDIYSLFFYSLDSKTEWEKGYSEYSAFEPFTCSCGVAGCAGIWNGIYVKNRKYSIEWRAKKEDGYGILDKNFYSFDKRRYISALKQLHRDLTFLDDKLDTKAVVDMGYCDGDETTVRQFLNFANKKAKPKNKFW